MSLRRSFLSLVLLAFIAAPAAYGQAKDSPIAFSNLEPITATLVTAPNLGGSSLGSAAGDNPQWLKVEFHFGTTSALTTKYLDSVEFKVWIEGLDLLAKNAPVPGKGVAVALTGSVNYVNVPANKDIYGVFYVHPSSVGRYSGTGGAEDFNRRFNVHMEAYVGGVLMDAIDKRKETDPKWFQPLTVVPNLVFRQDQCVFIIADPDRYPAIKLTPSAGAQ